MLFDLLVIGSIQDSKAYPGVFVDAGGEESTNRAGTNNQNVERISNRRHTGGKLSVTEEHAYMQNC